MPSVTTLTPSRQVGPPARTTTFEDRILEAAAGILDAGIIADYNVDNIAREAGISVSTVYDRFPGKKNAITRALYEVETSKALAHVPTGVDAAWEMSAIIWGMVEVGLKRPTMTRLLFAERARLMTAAKGEVGQELLTARIGQCLLSGEYPDDARSPEVCCDVVAIIDGLIATACARAEHDVGVVSHRVSLVVVHCLASWARNEV